MSDKVVVITGASSGIGAELARQLGARGEKLVLCARRERLLGEVAAASGNALAVPGDMTKRADAERLRDRAIAEHGRIDAWVNNAGRGLNRRVEDLTDEDVGSTLASVLFSTLYGMQAVLPHFKKRGAGHIVNVSSFLGRVPITPYRSIYSASKAAVNVLSANLRMDLRQRFPGIRVSVVMPGVVDTPFHEIAGPGLPARAGGFLGLTRIESAAEVASKIADLLDHPVPELYTGDGASHLVETYFRDVGAFEEGFAARAGARPGPASQ